MKKHSDSCTWQSDWTMCNCGALNDLVDLNQQFDHLLNFNTLPVVNTKWYNCAYCEAGYPDQGCTCGDTCGKSN